MERKFFHKKIKFKILSIRSGLDIDCSEVNYKTSMPSPADAFKFFAKALFDKETIARHVETPIIQIKYLEEGKEISIEKQITPENIEEIYNFIKDMYDKKALISIESRVKVVWASIDPRNLEVYSYSEEEPIDYIEDDKISIYWNKRERKYARYARIDFDFYRGYKMKIIREFTNNASLRLGKKLRFDHVST